MRRADERVLLEFKQRLNDFLRSVNVSQTPARHAVAFAEPVHDNRLIVKLSRGDELGIVAEETIDFVADQRDVLFFRQRGDVLYNLQIGNGAGRVAGRIENNHLRLVGNGVFDLVDVKLEIRVRVDKNGFRAHHLDQRRIHDKMRVEHDDLVAGIDHRQNNQQQSAGNAAADKRLTVGVSVKSVDFLLNLFSQQRGALRGRVPVFAGHDSVARRLTDVFRNVEVRLSDRQVDRINQFRAQVKDLANSRGVKGKRTISKPFLVHDNCFLKCMVKG